ncbi:MAG: GNAT family N-acetyltransferase [Crocinitomicaceae bacterium]|nr:GNAT family N-acetyltransferase [Crocinitomicaceae bacterium]
MIQIRKAENKDFKLIYNFINELENAIFDEKIQQVIFSENLKNENIIYVLAFQNDEPAGFISCHAQWLLHHAALIGEIQEMIVAEKFRSKGVGKLLIEALINIAKSNGINQLEVTSSKKRESAHRFYMREGFAQSHFKFTRHI